MPVFIQSGLIFKAFLNLSSDALRIILLITQGWAKYSKNCIFKYKILSIFKYEIQNTINKIKMYLIFIKKFLHNLNVLGVQKSSEL